MNQPSYTSGRQDVALLATTVGDAFDATVARHAEREALVVRHQRLRYSWRQLAERVDAYARAFIALGLRPGERLGIWAPNCAEWCITQFASAKVGAVLVNINPAYRSSELEYALKQSGCSWLICADAFKTSDYHAMLGDLLPELARARPGELASERLPELRGVISLAERAPAGFLHWQGLPGLAAAVGAEELRQRQASLQFDEPINIQYTSGTTGFPKGATLSHYNILNNGYMVGESLGLGAEDRLVIPVPLYHCFGMVMGNLGCVTHGSTMIYPAPSFDAEATLLAVAEERATALYGVPTMFIAELDHPRRREFDLSSLRTGIMAGATCPIEVMRRVIGDMHMAEVQIAYGMTETSPVSLQTGPDDGLELRVTTVGRTQPRLESKIVDQTGRVVPRGEIGELCTRGYSVMLGYWNDPQATAEAIDPARWMHTGDLAVMDDDGYVRIVGRSKDMIIRGGENIYPRELEEFFFTHPAVADVQVIGIPDERYGEEIVAWIKLHPGHHADDEQLRAFCKARIAHFKIPRHFKFVDEFPMTVTGKIQKFRMREVSIEEIRLLALRQGAIERMEPRPAPALRWRAARSEARGTGEERRRDSGEHQGHHLGAPGRRGAGGVAPAGRRGGGGPPGRRYRSAVARQTLRAGHLARLFAALAGSGSAHGRRVLRHGRAAPEEWQLRFHEPLRDPRADPGTGADRHPAIPLPAVRRLPAAPAAPRRPGGNRPRRGAGPVRASAVLLHPVDDHPWPGLLAGRPAHPDPGHRPALSAAGLHRGLPGDVQRQPAFLPSPQPPAVQCRLPGSAGPPRQAGAATLPARRAGQHPGPLSRSAEPGGADQGLPAQPAAGTLAGRGRARRAFLHGALDPAPQAVPGRAELPGAEGPGPPRPGHRAAGRRRGEFRRTGAGAGLRRWQRVPQGVQEVDRLDPGQYRAQVAAETASAESSGVLSETLGRR